jgi:hypothetical protein
VGLDLGDLGPGQLAGGEGHRGVVVEAGHRR